MSIWDRLPARTWDMIQDIYPTWADIEGKRWYTVTYGYLYAAPIIRSMQSSACFLTEPFLFQIRVTEDLEPEFGGELMETGDPFTGTVTASFQGVEYPLAYNEGSGCFEATLPGPQPEDWAEDAYIFTIHVAAANDRGKTDADHQLVVYKVVPAVLAVNVPECTVGENFPLRATLGMATRPAGGPVEDRPFLGTATVDFQGDIYELQETEELRIFTAVVTAPDVTSWHQEGHVYAGIVTAYSVEESATATFGVRVRETTPPELAHLTPTQDVFICNYCSPQFRWAAVDPDSGLASITVEFDRGPPATPKLHNGVVCWQMPVTVSGNHTITLTAIDNDGNRSALERVITGIRLVTDRKKSDVSRLKALIAKRWVNLSAAERLEYYEGSANDPEHWADGEKLTCVDGQLYALEGFNRGAYNTDDINRVEFICTYLANRLAEHGVNVAPEVREDWDIEDIPTESDMARYLGNVGTIVDARCDLLTQVNDYYGAFVLQPEALPSSMSKLSVDGANAIEKELVYLERFIAWLEAFDWYIESRARTWTEVEAAYPSWADLDGTPWWKVQVGRVIETELRPPWEVLDSRYSESSA